MLKNIVNRDSALRPLSRDHGVLLVLAQKLQKAASSGAQNCAHLYEEIRAELAPLTKSYLADRDTTDTSTVSDVYMYTEEIESKRRRPTQRPRHSINLNREAQTA